MTRFSQPEVCAAKAGIKRPSCEGNSSGCPSGQGMQQTRRQPREVMRNSQSPLLYSTPLDSDKRGRYCSLAPSGCGPADSNVHLQRCFLGGAEPLWQSVTQSVIELLWQRTKVPQSLKATKKSLQLRDLGRPYSCSSLSSLLSVTGLTPKITMKDDHGCAQVNASTAIRFFSA